MTMEEIVRILKENKNICLNNTTLKEISKEEIEKEVGFKIEVALVTNNGFIFQKVDK